MSIDFSAALRAEAEQKFRSDLLASIARLETKIEELHAKLDVQGKKTKPEAKE